MANKHTCEICGTSDHYRWHGGEVIDPEGNKKYYKDVCDDCWPNIPRKQTFSGMTGATHEQRIELNLKRGQYLGPKVDGVRGIFQRRRR